MLHIKNILYQIVFFPFHQIIFFHFHQNDFKHVLKIELMSQISKIEMQKKKNKKKRLLKTVNSFSSP